MGIILFALTLLFWTSQDNAARVEHLRDVRVIHITSFGTSEGAIVIREKVVNRLATSGKVTLTESEEKADAILTGLAKMEKDDSIQVEVNPNSSNRLGTPVDATLVVRLVTRDKQILWAGEADNGLVSFGLTDRTSPGKASSRVANKIANGLLKAIEKDRKRK